MDSKKKKLGQYFTKNEILQDIVYKLILNSPNKILEPSVGRGDLVNYVKIKSTNVKFDMYEIDETINHLDNINKDDIIYGDFLKKEVNNKYETIIGNPPFYNTKGIRNIYIDFIEKCYNLLIDNGELIFIVPSDFIKLTSSAKLINDMISNGTFTHIHHPNTESLFDNASIDIIIFRYCKNKNLDNKVKYYTELNDKDVNEWDDKYLINSNGIITLNDNNEINLEKINNYFNVYVGMVSGKEEVFKNDKLGNIKILNKKNKIDNYIYLKNFPSNNEELNSYLLKNKDILLKRKIKKFNENNFYEWGAPRNITNIEKNYNKKCIYIQTLTRDNNVVFIDKVQYFGGSLIMLIPKNDNINLDKIINYFNSNNFKKNYLYSGRFKIGHKQISNHLLNISNFI